MQLSNQLDGFGCWRRASTSSMPGAEELKTNFVSDKPSSWFAELYQKDQLTGGHVIMLGADEGSRWVGQE